MTLSFLLPLIVGACGAQRQHGLPAARAQLSYLVFLCHCPSLQVRVEPSGSMASQLQVPTFFGLIKLLATCAAGSHTVAESLLQVRRAASH